MTTPHLRIGIAASLMACIVALAGAAPAGAALPSKELRCRKALAKQTHRYLARVQRARVRCLHGIFAGEISPGIDCIDGDGDERVRRKIEAERNHVATVIPQKCGSIDLSALGFPGACASAGECETDTDCIGIQGCIASRCALEDATFSATHLEACFIGILDREIASMLNAAFPPPAFVRGRHLGCVAGAGRHAATMVRRLVRARSACLLLTDELDGLAQTLRCRDDLPPCAQGTGEATADRRILQSYVGLLAGVPEACRVTKVDKLGYVDHCADTTGGRFTTFDLKVCLFDQHRAAATNVVEAVFPLPPDCGDGVVCSEPACTGGPGGGPEQCDDGAANSDTQPNACRTDCALPACGDGVIDFGEACDPLDGTTCADDCTILLCGNGDLDAGEECDDGAANSDTAPDACRKDCSEARCGDGIVDPGNLEACDDGADNSDTTADACRTSCTEPFCGDGIVDSGEQCDDGPANSESGACRSDCTRPPIPCTVTFGMTSAETLGAIQYEVDYNRAPGGFAGTDVQVECTSLVAGVFAQFSDDEARRVVGESIISTRGFTGPTALASCEFGSIDPANLEPGDFTITVLTASTLDLELVEPTLVVSAIDCAE